MRASRLAAVADTAGPNGGAPGHRSLRGRRRVPLWAPRFRAVVVLGTLAFASLGRNASAAHELLGRERWRGGRERRGAAL